MPVNLILPRSKICYSTRGAFTSDHMSISRVTLYSLKICRNTGFYNLENLILYISTHFKIVMNMLVFFFLVKWITVCCFFKITIFLQNPTRNKKNPVREKETSLIKSYWYPPSKYLFLLVIKYILFCRRILLCVVVSDSVWHMLSQAKSLGLIDC